RRRWGLRPVVRPAGGAAGGPAGGSVVAPGLLAGLLAGLLGRWLDGLGGDRPLGLLERAVEHAGSGVGGLGHTLLVPEPHVHRALRRRAPRRRGVGDQGSEPPAQSTSPLAPGWSPR